MQYEDQDEDQPEFKAAKRVESADLLAKLKVRARIAHSSIWKAPVDQQYDRAYYSGVAHRYLPNVFLPPSAASADCWLSKVSATVAGTQYKFAAEFASSAQSVLLHAAVSICTSAEALSGFCSRTTFANTARSMRFTLRTSLQQKMRCSSAF